MLKGSTSYTNMDNLIQIIPVLNEDELNDLNTYTDKNLAFTRSTTFNGENTKIDSGRTSTECTLPENENITKRVHEKINAALDEYKRKILQIHSGYNTHPLPGANDTTSWREALRVIQYTKGQQYGFHHDQGTLQSRMEYHRQISVILYLTDDFEGGGTAFTHKTFNPKKGDALIFPSNWCYIHQGNQVTSGTKRVLVTWYYVDSRI
jgi:predicted 2-oxoglutarate/Fe(II)-dependent dioxygenase YbiX|tara:strand:- start:4023 stop:4643 length:621 start_codon:yes stop_codon:yes gene_type:complete